MKPIVAMAAAPAATAQTSRWCRGVMWRRSPLCVVTCSSGSEGAGAGRGGGRSGAVDWWLRGGEAEGVSVGAAGRGGLGDVGARFATAVAVDGADDPQRAPCAAVGARG